MRVTIQNVVWRRRDGSAVVVVIVLLAIMLIYIGANLKTLNSMGRELNLIEKRQVHRLATLPAVQGASATNQPVNSSTAPTSTKDPSPPK